MYKQTYEKTYAQLKELSSKRFNWSNHNSLIRYEIITKATSLVKKLEIKGIKPPFPSLADGLILISWTFPLVSIDVYVYKSSYEWYIESAIEKWYMEGKHGNSNKVIHVLSTLYMYGLKDMKN